MNSKPKNPINWQTLKDYANSLNEEELKQSVIVQGEDMAIRVQSAEGLEEDYYVTDEGLAPVSEWNESDHDEDDKLEDYCIIPKGTPFLHTDLWE